MKMVRKNKKYRQLKKDTIQNMKASCKYCCGNLSVIEDNDSLQLLGRMWNFKCSENLCKFNTLPEHYITPKNEKHLEITRKLILAMQAT